MTHSIKKEIERERMREKEKLKKRSRIKLVWQTINNW